MSYCRVTFALIICQAVVALGSEPHTFRDRYIGRTREPYRQPTYCESPHHRAQRALNSPSLYAGPYPGGGLYAWRQRYYDRLRHPLFDHSRHRVYSLLPYSQELSMAQSPAYGIADVSADVGTDDPVSRLQRNFFTDDLHSPEDLLQLRLGY